MPYQQTTLLSLQTQLASRTEGNPWWSAEEARLAVNEGLRIWNALTGFWVTKFYPGVVPNDPYVALPNAMTQATRVLWNGIPLEKCSLTDLDYGIPNWRNAVSGVSPHPSRPSYWAPVALTLLVIYPADNGLDFPASMEVAGVHDTPILTAPGDFVDLGEEELDILLAYAQHVLAFKVGGQRLVDSYAGWIGLLKAAAAENSQIAASAFYRRLLGLDMQRQLRRQTRVVENPVDRVLANLPAGESQ